MKALGAFVLGALLAGCAREVGAGHAHDAALFDASALDATLGDAPAPVACGTTQLAAQPTPGPSGVCNDAGWCWSYPTPQGDDLRAVWALAPDDVWAGGANGTVMHFDGRDWTLSAAGLEFDVNALWASGPRDVWAVSPANALAHWDGARWTRTELPSVPTTPNLPFAISGTAPDDVWVVGDRAVFHWDGARWSLVTSQFGARAVLAAARDDVWALGNRDETWHWDGRAWTAQRAAVVLAPGALWGSGPRDVWAVGARGTMAHWDGASWSDRTRRDEGASLVAIAGTSASDVWAVGSERSSSGVEVAAVRHWDGARWSRHTLDPPGVPLRAVHARATNDAWAVGDHGETFHWDGGAWRGVNTTVPTTDGTGVVGLGDIWGSSARDVWAVGASGVLYPGEGALLHYDGSAWSRVEGCGSSGWWAAVWGSGPRDVWAVGAGGAIAHYDGVRWTLVASAQPYDLLTVWGSGPDDVWAAGTMGEGQPLPGYLHWDGTRWSQVGDFRRGRALAPPRVTRIAGSGRNDVWTLLDVPYETGSGSRLVHWDGTQWAVVPLEMSLGDTFRAISGSADGVWLAGDRQLYHSVGGAWVALPLDAVIQTGARIAALWARTASDVWAASYTTAQQSALHWDGRTWTTSLLPRDPLDSTIRAIWSADDSSVWTGLHTGVLVHRP